jgi:hypothetical protein
MHAMRLHDSESVQTCLHAASVIDTRESLILLIVEF